MILSGGKNTRINHSLELFEERYDHGILLTYGKKLRFSHLFPTNEMIAQTMIEENEMIMPVSTNPLQNDVAILKFDDP